MIFVKNKALSKGKTDEPCTSSVYKVSMNCSNPIF